MIVGIPAHGEWSYTKQSGGYYQVTLREHGQVLTYDSHQPRPNAKNPQSARP
jgi:hypothetical protein